MHRRIIFIVKRQFQRLLLWGLAALAPAWAWPLAAQGARAEEPLLRRKIEFFEKRIRPLLVNHCYECHGAEDPEGKLRLDTKFGWRRGGESGPAIVPGDPSASLLFRAVTYQDEKLQMPPPDSGKKLSPRQIQDLKTWIRQGAVDPRTGDAPVSSIDPRGGNHWSLQPIKPPDISPVIGASHHPIDYLIEKQLRAKGFVTTKKADPRTLIRRAVYDLHGLPPTPQQLARWRIGHFRDRPGWFSQLIDQLLASPRYGERWGRHWLDVARYSDAKDGVLMYGDARIRPFAYTYRDYIIRSFNDDKPFDRFIREQLAADQLGLPPDSPDLAGMGLLTLGRMFDSNPHDVIDDQIDVVTRGFLGLTVSCARCHDHKFDPIPTADYYSLYGVFASSMEPLERPRIESVGEQGKAYEEELGKKLQEVFSQRRKHYEKTLETARRRTPDYLVQVATTAPDISETTYFFLSLLPQQLRPQITYRWRKLIARRAYADDPVFGPWHDMMRQPKLQIERWRKVGVDPRIIDGLAAAKPRTKEEIARTYGEMIRAAYDQKYEPLASLLSTKESPVWLPMNEIHHYLSRQDKDAFRGLVNQLDAISVKHKAAAARAMVMVDSESPVEPVIFQRGDPGMRGAAVPRRFLTAVSGAKRALFAHGSGRLDLANAIASAENPLTARVWVNRVWMHHFGEPLVENPSDFGLRTSRPVQHELLDYLASTLIEKGWRTKPLHKLIMTSQAYQRASQLEDTPQMAKQWKLDPDNRLIWRANRRRLDLEQMRDTMLFISGELDGAMYGRPLLITNLKYRRRTVYAFVERQNIPSMVQTFDFANVDTSTARRVTTTVPQQALFVMNSGFVTQSAKALAERTSGGADQERIEKIYHLTLGRSPTDEELELGIGFVKTNPWEQYAQTLLMTNELMFVD